MESSNNAKMKEKIRDLSRICIDNGKPYFLINVLGNHYCSIGQGCHEVECPYFGEKDHNDLHTCDYYKDTEVKVDLN